MISMADKYERASAYVRGLTDPDARKRCRAMLDWWNYGYGRWPREDRMTTDMQGLADILYPSETT